jgi:hypothetical protein
MSSSTQSSKGKKRIKRVAESHQKEENDLHGGEMQQQTQGDANSDTVPINRLLFLKPEFSKKPWYVGGKCVFSRDGTTVYCPGQGGVAVVKNYSEISSILAKNDDIVSFAVAVSVYILLHPSRRQNNCHWQLTTTVSKNSQGQRRWRHVQDGGCSGFSDKILLNSEVLIQCTMGSFQKWILIQPENV